MKTGLPFIKENKQTRKKKTKTTQNNDSNNANLEAHMYNTNRPTIARTTNQTKKKKKRK